MVATCAFCVLLAALSLLAPSEPSFDPWAWLVWGREIAHLSLELTSGPSWKPLPVVFTTLFAPWSAVDDDIPPALWMLVARAGGLLAVALSFRLAARLVGGRAWRRWLAGGVAATALVMTPDWTRYLLHGSEAPLAIALLLWAVDRHLDGHRTSALGLGALVCLARPELFGFLVAYAGYVWWSRPDRRALVALGLGLVVGAWLLPGWLAAGDPLSAATSARSEPSWSLSLAPVPWRAALDEVQRQTSLALELTSLAATVLALAARSRLPRPARPGAVLALGGFGALVVTLFLAMTEAGFSGNPRYVLPALASFAVLGGVGAALLVDLGRQLADGLGERLTLARGSARLGAAAACAVVVAAAVPGIARRAGAVRDEARASIERSRLHSDLDRAVAAVGPSYVTRFGPVTTNRPFQTHLAWELSLRLPDVHGTDGRGILFRTPAGLLSGIVRVAPRASRRALIARVGSWTVSARPASARHIYSWPAVGFDLRTAARRG